LTPYFRIALYFVTQFLPAGAAHAYAGIWLADNGLSSVQIGVVNTFPIVLILLSNTFVGRVADRARDWRSALQICSLIFLVFSVGLFWAHDFWAILLCFAGMTVAGALSAPIGDAAALHLTSQGRGHIGTLRGLATAGYIGALFVTGFLAQSFGGVAYLTVSVGFAVLRLVASMALPVFKTDKEAMTMPATGVGYRALMRPSLFVPLASWALIYSAIQVLNSFLALHLKNEGYEPGVISWLFAIGACTEVVMFFAFRRFEHKLDLRLFIFISGALGVVRWLIMATSPSLPVLFLLQASHGVTYALGFVACLSFISRNTSQQEAAELQSFFNVLQMAVVVVFISGFSLIFDRMGAWSFAASAGVAGVGSLLVLMSYLKDRANQGIKH
jgi:MFS transporter, PPP family, 3-phenylpropionic acid transporter